MIHQKIAEAKLAKRKLFFKTLLIIILLSVFCVALILWASVPKTRSTSVETEQPLDIVESSPQENGNQDSETLRQQYLEAYAHFENTIKPELNKIDLPKWDEPLADRLNTNESAAIEQFGEAKYAQANATLDALIKLAETAISDSQNQFESAMQNAQQAFDDNQYEQAKTAISKALMLDSSSNQASALAERIEQLPEIASLVEQIEVANVENNPQTELRLINQLLTLTPEREALKQRAQALQTTLNNQKFQSLISQSYAAIDDGRIEAAKSALSQARNIYSNRAELSDVNTAIQQYEKNQRIQSGLTNAAKAESNDNWQAVKNNLEQVVKENPNNQSATEKLTMANNILSLDKQIDDYLKSPYRLSNSQLAEQARGAINAAAAYRNQSLSLTRKSRELETVLTAVNQTVPVEVRSDNQTHILVRGVGNVGVVDSKVIQLKPGQYTFEGKRQGYKSKLVEVTIPYDVNRFSLTLVCDEPI
ncbi:MULTISPECIES: hypothetical protein [unclassified Methylophaga]|jgi:hypothetical protein|uniref:hypothetical protein n=1 Tax=unclassified Methylophaga TaxID=2629249 RepID=UPI000C8AAF93|nr:MULTISPECIES: hypothetical protein [unclassified Methylophaga]MAL50780.1 hypothetical protein [Methylophaga sp.]HCC79783.1 hypothetical protein [Methylophaga sp.]|tara:strand:- start:2262 stop:3698 length:1437 start_codon:yes stop_codon:yes gene_type:complete